MEIVFWMLHIQLSSVSGAQQAADQRVKGVTLLHKVQRKEKHDYAAKPAICSHTHSGALSRAVCVLTMTMLTFCKQS